MSRQEVEYRGYRIIQLPIKEAAPLLGIPEHDAENRFSVAGFKMHHVFIVRDEFDECPLPLDTWFEAPITARSAIDIVCYKEGGWWSRTTFWPSFHDVYVCMREVPMVLRALQEVHREAVHEVENNIEISQGDFAFRVRDRLGLLMIDLLNSTAKK